MKRSDLDSPWLLIVCLILAAVTGFLNASVYNDICRFEIEDATLFKMALLYLIAPFGVIATAINIMILYTNIASAKCRFTKRTYRFNN